MKDMSKVRLVNNKYCKKKAPQRIDTSLTTDKCFSGGLDVAQAVNSSLTSFFTLQN